MKYLQQQVVVDKLTRAGRRMMRDRVENPASKFLRDGWYDMRKDVQAFVHGVWTQEQADKSPYGARRARQRISDYLETRIKIFRADAKGVLHTAMVQAYRLQYLLTAWTVDNATPPNMQVTVAPRAYRLHGRVRRHIGAKETQYSRSVDMKTRRLVESWFEEPTHEPTDTDDQGNKVQAPAGSLDTYLKAWGGSALVQAGMSMAFGAEPGDAADRVAGAKAGTYTPESAFDRVIRTQIQIAVMDAEDDFDNDNPGMSEQRIWRTMEDERVCDDCASQEGLSEDEWEFDLPAHPICRCFVERILVPFQTMAGDRAVPGAGTQTMVFHDPVTGEPAGTVLIQFDEWAGKQGVSVAGTAD